MDFPWIFPRTSATRHGSCVSLLRFDANFLSRASAPLQGAPSHMESYGVIESPPTSKELGDLGASVGYFLAFLSISEPFEVFLLAVSEYRDGCNHFISFHTISTYLFNISPLSSPSIIITMAIIIHNFSHFQHLFTLAASCPMDNTIENRPGDWTPQICLSSACPIPRVMPEGYVGHSEATWNILECPGNEWIVHTMIFVDSLCCFTMFYLHISASI